MADTPHTAASVAWDAAFFLDALKVDLDAVSSTSTLLSAAENLDANAQNAFRGLDLMINAINGKVEHREAFFDGIYKPLKIETVAN
jgi:hypothetical protein